MIQEAVVTKVNDDGTAEVVLERYNICDGNCLECEKCIYEKVTKVKVANPIGAFKGQKVMVESDSAKMFKAALSIYILPMIFFFVGFGLGALAGFPQETNILFSFVFLAIGALVASIMAKNQHKNNPIPSTIIEILYR